MSFIVENWSRPQENLPKPAWGHRGSWWRADPNPEARPLGPAFTHRWTLHEYIFIKTVTYTKDKIHRSLSQQQKNQRSNSMGEHIRDALETMLASTLWGKRMCGWERPEPTWLAARQTGNVQNSLENVNKRGTIWGVNQPKSLWFPVREKLEKDSGEVQSSPLNQEWLVFNHV